MQMFHVNESASELQQSVEPTSPPCEQTKLSFIWFYWPAIVQGWNNPQQQWSHKLKNQPHCFSATESVASILNGMEKTTSEGNSDWLTSENKSRSSSFTHSFIRLGPFSRIGLGLTTFDPPLPVKVAAKWVKGTRWWLAGSLLTDVAFKGQSADSLLTGQRFQYGVSVWRWRAAGGPTANGETTLVFF